MTERASDCRACGCRIWSGPRGPLKSYCEDCRAIRYQRRNARSANPAVERPKEERSEQAREAARVRWAGHVATVKWTPVTEPIVGTCQACGRTWEQWDRLRRLICSSCREQHGSLKRALRARRVERYACGRCGSEFERPATRGQRPKWCLECREAGVYNINWRAKKTDAYRRGNRIASARRRARQRGGESERFDPLEIFQRDGWKCGICGRKVDKRLKHPHPRSASMDHILPYSAGGYHLRANVQCSHLTCNEKKHAGIGGNGDQLRLIG